MSTSSASYMMKTKAKSSPISTNSLNMQSMTRALSPVDAAMAVHANQSTSSSRLASLTHAVNFSEVMRALPMSYRDRLMPIFQLGTSAATKHDSATTALAKWKQHKKDGTFPSFMEGMKEPAPQFSNMGRDDSATKAVIDGLGVSFREFRVMYLDAAITAKEKDIAILAEAMSQETVVGAAYAEAKSIYEGFVSKYVKTSVTSEGVITYLPNPIFKTEFDHLVEDLATIYARASQITLSHLESVRKANERAPLVKKAADVEMASGDGLSSASLSKMIDDRVSKALEGRPGKSSAAAIN